MTKTKAKNKELLIKNCCRDRVALNHTTKTKSCGKVIITNAIIKNLLIGASARASTANTNRYSIEELYIEDTIIRNRLFLSYVKINKLTIKNSMIKDCKFNNRSLVINLNIENIVANQLLLFGTTIANISLKESNISEFIFCFNTCRDNIFFDFDSSLIEKVMLSKNDFRLLPVIKNKNKRQQEFLARDNVNIKDTEYSLI